MPRANVRAATLGSPLATVLTWATVFALAALVRLGLIRDARFTGDESIFYQTIHDLATRADASSFPWLGPALTGGQARHPGALFFYLLAPSQWLSATPESANACVALLGAVAVTLTWSALRRPFGERAAALVGVMLALSPWSALYADRLWNSNVIGFLAALAFWAITRLREDSGSARPRHAAIAVAAMAVMPQFHMSAPVLWAALAAYALASPRPAPGRARLGLLAGALGGLMIGLAFYVPYAIHEWRTGFANLRLVLGESGTGRHRLPHEVFSYLFRFLTLDVSYHELGGYRGHLADRELLPAAFGGVSFRPFHPLRLLALLSSIALAVTAIAAAWRDPRYRPLRAGLVAGALAAIALLGWTGKPFFPHYVQPLLPFVFAMFACVPRTPLRLALVAVFCLGSIDALVAINRRSDAMNGLRTERRVIEQLLAEVPDGRVRVSAGYYWAPEAYGVLSRTQYGGRLSVGDVGPRFALSQVDGAVSVRRLEDAR